MRKEAPDPLFTLRGHHNSVTALTFLKNSTNSWNLVSADTTGEIFLWNLDTFRHVSTVKNKLNSSVTWMKQSKKHTNILYAQVRDCAIFSLDINNNLCNLQKVVPLQNEGFCQCEILQTDVTSDLLAYPGSRKSSINIFDSTSSSITHKLIPKETSSYGMLMCLKSVHVGNQDLIAAGYENGNVALWDVRNLKMLSQLSINQEPVMCIDAFPISNTVHGYIGSADNFLNKFTCHLEKNVFENHKIELRSKGSSCVNIRGDHKIVCSSSWDGSLLVFSCKTGKLLALLDYHSTSVNCLQFCDEKIANHGYILAAGSKDCPISLWSIYS